MEPVASYNVNIIAYHRQCLDDAYVAKSVLVDNVESMNEWVAQSYCFQLSNNCLRLHDVLFATTVSSSAENFIFVIVNTAYTPFKFGNLNCAYDKIFATV